MMATWMDGWKPTKKPGIWERHGAYRVRVRAVSSATGALREANRVFENVTLKQAVLHQMEMKEEIRNGSALGARQRVSDFAKLWLATKLPTIDLATGERYTSALEDHALVELGDYYLDVLKAAHVQAWVNKELKRWAVDSVRGWFRVFRTMARDAVEQLDLERDPTGRVNFPESPEREEANALTPEQLHAFLTAMQAGYYRNYALTCVLAFTGLRFCHASAIKWEDVDETAGVIKIVRKNIRGRVGPVSRKKRAPKNYPIGAELVEILREWRRWQIKQQVKGIDSGWVFPGRTGKLRTPGSLWKAWTACLDKIGVEERFTVHGLRRTFNDLCRRGGIDPVTTRSLTGHVTEKMREHYSSVAIDEQRAAVGAVVKLVRSGDVGGDRKVEKEKAG